MVYPNVSGAPPSSPDLPDDVAECYLEAAAIVNKSPRGAAALLRLAIQKLLKHLGNDDRDLNNAVACEVRKGLLPRVQQALDVVRLIGNEAVHPGQIDLNDKRETAIALFSLVNLIAEQMITSPREAENLYSALPQAKRDAIEKRDRPAS